MAGHRQNGFAPRAHFPAAKANGTGWLGHVQSRSSARELNWDLARVGVPLYHCAEGQGGAALVSEHIELTVLEHTHVMHAHAESLVSSDRIVATGCSTVVAVAAEDERRPRCSPRVQA
jgi:hypothetical protein